MLILGHAGITLGASILLSGIKFSERRSAQTKGDSYNKASGAAVKEEADHTGQAGFFTRRLNSLAGHIDIRVLFIGSLLPDIIDKPTGLLIFRDTIGNGRIFCHTLLFLIIIVLAGLYIYRKYHKNWLLVLSFGTFMHFILDEMWRQPRTLLWPILGITFDKEEIYGWWWKIITGFMSNPKVYVSEFVGAVILLWFVIVLLHRKKLSTFILHSKNRVLLPVKDYVINFWVHKMITICNSNIFN